jgi:hypothetical protein
LIVTDQQHKKERIRMKSKTKTNKVPKSAKTRLSDLTPQKEARGGKYPAAVAPGPGPAPTPPGFNPPSASLRKRQITA